MNFNFIILVVSESLQQFDFYLNVLNVYAEWPAEISAITSATEMLDPAGSPASLATASTQVMPSRFAEAPQIHWTACCSRLCNRSATWINAGADHAGRSTVRAQAWRGPSSR